ncbi:methyltransferase domain-containing protein [Nonomuraea candida]|uniref:methyltransferase domain-containing protein n=1 Tax=Nonomuraea candida TaxID=359159 RepID=UPI0006936947|nr:methyltransferase domain-containing protein [Nonomuraea candida]
MSWQDVRFRDRVGPLVEYLAAQGVIDRSDWASAAWATGLHEVPRHVFVPSRAYAAAYQPGESSRPIDRKANATDWWRACYTDCSIITQRDDGATAPDDPTGTPTCSLSAPGIALAFLDLLDVRDHHRVLEIGTGTGWTAAMLAWRLSSRQVVSVEVDPELADLASENVRRAGFAPTLITGDGAEGMHELAPYDRVHVTCGVREVPYAWIEQTRPGGRIVLPYMPAPTAEQGGLQLALTVLDDGTAIGRFHGRAGYMMLRSQRRQQGARPGGGDGRAGSTRFDPRTLDDLLGRYDGAVLMLAALVPTIAIASSQERLADGWGCRVHLRDLAGDAWAVCESGAGAEFEVVEGGDRDLWDEVQAAYFAWVRAGHPGRDRFGLTVTPHEQTIWLDAPS